MFETANNLGSQKKSNYKKLRKIHHLESGAHKKSNAYQSQRKIKFLLTFIAQIK